MDYQTMQNRLDRGYGLLRYDYDEIDYAQQPIGKAIYSSSEEDIGTPEIINEKLPYWRQRCICKHCGTEVSKARYSKHRRTKSCMIYQKVHQKILDIIIKS